MVKISTCCGSKQLHPDYDICPDCLEHCEYISEDDVSEYRHSSMHIYHIYANGKFYDGVTIIHNDLFTIHSLLNGYIRRLSDMADDDSLTFGYRLISQKQVKIYE